MKTRPTKAVNQALAAAILFGASAPFSKLLLGEMDAIPLAAFLYLGSGMIGWVLFLIQRIGNQGRMVEAHLVRKDLPWLAGAILAGGVGAPILLLISLERTPATTASLLLNFEGAATVILAVLLFREAVNRRVLWAVGLITLASIILTWTGGGWGFSLGAMGILAACFLWGVDNNFTRHISARNPLIIVGVKGLAAGGFSLALALSLGKQLPAPGLLGLGLLVGAVCYGLSIQLFILALRGLGAARTGALFGAAPFGGSILSVIIFNELPTILFWVSLPIMLVGAWLMVSEKHEHGQSHEEHEHTHTHQHPDDHHRH